jgi:hypothetical protein
MREAARLFGAAEGQRTAIGKTLLPWDRADHNRYVETARAALGEAAFAVLWAEGRDLSLKQAAAVALASRRDRGAAAVREPSSRSGAAAPDSPRKWPQDDLTQEEWERIAPLLPAASGRKGRPYRDHRLVLNGIFWVLRTSAAWRDLPAHYGSWKTCQDRYRRWRRTGLWGQIEQALDDPIEPDRGSRPADEE